MDQHFNPLIHQRLRQIFAAADWEMLTTYLISLSNAHFRTAGYLIGERMLTDVPADTFWDVATRLILWKPKAFTVTMAKAATPRLQSGSLSLNDKGYHRLVQALQPHEHLLDREKLLLQWLPTVTEPSTMEQLFTSMNINEPQRRIDFLLRTNTLTASFVILRTLRFEEHNREYLTKVCRQLIRRASTLSQSTGQSDRLSFNLASLLRAFFDLDDIRGTFSLSIQPYELSRLDTDFDVFKRIVTKV